jgi:hypothetical protein
LDLGNNVPNGTDFGCVVDIAVFIGRGQLVTFVKGFVGSSAQRLGATIPGFNALTDNDWLFDLSACFLNPLIMLPFKFG